MAAADWFVIVQDEIRGPFTSDQMRSAAQKGMIVGSTSVRRGKEGDWFRADQIQGLIPAQPPASPPPATPAVTNQPVESPAAAPAVAAPTAGGNAITPQVSPARPEGANRRRRSRRKANPLAVLGVAGAGIGLLLGLLIYLTREPDPTETSAGDKTEQTGSESAD